MSSLEFEGERSDQYVWGVQGISNTRRLLTPLRNQFILKREQVDLLLDEILPRMERGVHHEKKGFLEVMHHVDRFNSYKGGSRGKYTLEYFQNLWEMDSCVSMATRDIYEATFDEDVQTDSSANQCPEFDGRVTINAVETST